MEPCTPVKEQISLFSVLLCVLKLHTNFSVLVSDNLLIISEQEFDNYAEWDLRDIDFVEDDSDILHGKSRIFLYCPKPMFRIAYTAFHLVFFSLHTYLKVNMRFQWSHFFVMVFKYWHFCGTHFQISFKSS